VGVEENIDETLTFYRLPRQHHKYLKSTNMLERLNEEIRRRTHVVRIFPNGESCLRLVRALAVETHENWLEQHPYLNMDDLREHKKEALRQLCALFRKSLDLFWRPLALIRRTLRPHLALSTQKARRRRFERCWFSSVPLVREE
jgi:hypothetical protein